MQKVPRVFEDFVVLVLAGLEVMALFDILRHTTTSIQGWDWRVAIIEIVFSVCIPIWVYMYSTRKK